MDLTAPARDIEELVAAFADMQGTELAQMKELWRARNFSFIHEARPKDVRPSFYAQGLFSSALIHVVGDESLNWKVGALYVLYTLHGTQLQESCCKIYLSLEELEALLSLVKEIKKQGLTTALVVLRKMFAENMFLFGSVSANQKRIATTVARLVKQANARVHQARFRLLTNVPMQQHLSGHLGQELKLDELAQLTEEYAEAKRRALGEDTDEGKEITEEGTRPTLGAALLKDTKSWDVHKAELLTPSQPRSNQALVSADSAGVGSERRKRKSSSEPRKKTITEYERELRERSKMSEFERELVAQLNLALDNLD